jgi:ClpP class serine protease
MDFNILNLFWIFLILSSLQPIVRQKMLEWARNRAIRNFEEKRGTRVILLIHRQETLSLLGFPIARYIDINDSEAVLRAIKLTSDEVPIDLVLHTPGGLVLASEQIAHALCRHPGKVTVFVPHYAMSGGTLLALAAHEIVMDENAVLGPVDPHLQDRPAVSILKVLEQKDLNEIDDETLIMADVAEKAVRQVKRTVREILISRGTEGVDADELAEALASGHWTHDYPISVEEAQELGLQVATGMPEEIYELMNLFPQTRQRRPSVQFIPMPYTERPTRRSPADGNSR